MTAHEILVDIKCLELGIVPLSIMQKTNPFEGMSDSEAKKVKRKFRKLKRKLSKKEYDGAFLHRKSKSRDVYHSIQMKVYQEMLS